MKYNELSPAWQRVFSLGWESLLSGSKAIGAVIVSDTGEIISEGRNKVSENQFPNYRVAHAETEAITNLDLQRYPYPEKYTLYAGLEPCVMCFGTMIMGHVRNIIIAARDGHGGAMELNSATEFIRRHPVHIEYAEPMLGYVQRTMQAFRELLKTSDISSREHTLAAISILHPESVTVAKKLVDNGYIVKAIENNEDYSKIFDKVVEELEQVI